MSRRVQPYTDNFLRGLQDTHPATDLDFPGWSVFQDVRVGRGTARRRPGIHKLSDGLPQTTLRFGGTEMVRVPNSGVIRLDRKWCLETFVTLINPTGVEPVIGWESGSGPITLRTNNGVVEVSLYDSASNKTDLSGGAIGTNDPSPIRVTRNRDVVQLLVDDVVVDEGSMDPDLLMLPPNSDLNIGGDGGVPAFHGDIEFVRVMKVIPSTRHSRQRWPHPLGRYMISDYVIDGADTGTDIVLDRSWNKNPGRWVGSVTQRASLVRKSQPVQGMLSYVDSTNTQRLALVVGGYASQEVI